MNVGERNARVITDTAHDEVIADLKRVFHRSRRNDTRLADGAVDQQENEADPKPRDDFAADFLFRSQPLGGLFGLLVAHNSPKLAVIPKKCETACASGFRWDG